MRIITISREHGSCGREIGLAVAKAFGVELYDRDIIRNVAKESGLEYDYLSMEAEQITKADSFLRKITPMQYDQKDSLFDMQKEIILKFADQGPCVILGRCADAILSEAGYETFNVFLHANDQFRAKALSERQGIDDMAEAVRQMRKSDASRKAHYERYSGRSWADYRNYDLMIDTSVFGIEESSRLIVDAVKSLEK